jgi:preprotein translocase subunit SecE
LDHTNDNADQDMNTEQNTAVVSDSRRRRRRVEETDQAMQSTTTTSRKDRPTPSARSVKPRGSATGLVYRIPVVRGIVTYFRGVISELQKVTWPNREETTRLTSVVLAVTIAFAIVLGILDTFLAWWFKQAFSETSELVFLGIAVGVVVVAGGAYTLLRNRL